METPKIVPAPKPPAPEAPKAINAFLKERNWPKEGALAKAPKPPAPIAPVAGTTGGAAPAPVGKKELVAGGVTIRAWDLNSGKPLVVEGKIDAGSTIDIYVKL